jgi:hypothetical protein
MQKLKGAFMKPQEPQQPKNSNIQNSEKDSKGRSLIADNIWNDRDKSSSMTPKDRSPASTKQYEDVKPRDSNLNATDIDKSIPNLDEDLRYKKDDIRQENGPRFDQDVIRNSRRRN